MAVARFNSFWTWLFAGLLLAACTPDAGAQRDIAVMSEKRDLIVLAAPRSGDSYYASRAQDIFGFHVEYARRVAEHDDVLVLVDAAQFDAYAEALGEQNVAIAPQADIWMRDFTLSNAERPVMFRYTAAGQGGGGKGQSEADFVQETFAEWAEAAGLSFEESDLLNDGGNFVDDYAGRAIVSGKFLRDNKLGEDEARAMLREATGVEYIAFIEADEQGGLEHADGVAAFIEPNVVVINSYPDDLDYAVDLRADLEAGLPGVTIHEIVTPYDGSDVHDGRFGSACGLYTNMLVTPLRIYLPQFGIAEDAQALASIRSWSDKQVIPVPSGGICAMGGGVRCMAWQVRGENREKLLAWAREQG